MRRRKRRSSSSKTRSHQAARSVAVEVVELDFLTPDEESDRHNLERKVERAFYEAGLALAVLRDRRLYRSTHLNFESYCRDRFGFTRDSAYLKIAAAEVYRNLEANLPTNGRQQNDAISLPTNERQVRPIVKAGLEPTEQVEVWSAALEEAGEGKLPSGRIVKTVVDRLTERELAPIPFRVGEVCQILGKDNPELKGKGGCWGIIKEVLDFSCILATWDNEYQLRAEYLESLNFSEFECKRMEDLGVRMSELYEKRLEEAALGVLNKLARIDRAYLTDLEEELLKVLERKYNLRS